MLRSRFITSLTAGLLIGVLPALAQAQAPGPFRAPPDPGSSALPPPGTIREGAVAPTKLFIAEPPGNTLLATDYLGRAIYGPGNAKVGSVSNLLVDTTGRIVGIVIDIGGFLGVGKKEIAIAFEAVYPIVEDDKEAFVVELTKEQLAAAPAFKRSQ